MNGEFQLLEGLVAMLTKMVRGVERQRMGGQVQVAVAVKVHVQADDHDPVNAGSRVHAAASSRNATGLMGITCDP